MSKRRCLQGLGVIACVDAVLMWIGKHYMPRKPVLKQFAALTQADFVGFPVWVSTNSIDHDEPWFKETDEETFRPWTGPSPVGPAAGMFLVRAELRLADGRLLHGFITPQHENEPLDLGIVQPQLFLPSGRRCDFWDGMFQRPAEDRKVIYIELGQDPAAIFPIRFSVAKGLATGQVSGMIPGFCWCPEKDVQVYH